MNETPTACSEHEANVTTGGLCRWKAIDKEGRHVGLDFYDLLIEAIALPVFLGGFDNPVGLVPLSTSTPPGTVPTNFKWDQSPDVTINPKAGAIARTVPPPAPRGIALPNNPKLFVTSTELARTKVGSLAGTARVDRAGKFWARLKLPADLPHGVFTVEAFQKGGKSPLTSAQFAKPYSDKGLAEKRD